MRIFHTDVGHEAHAFLSIGSAVFQLEQVLRERRIEHASVPVIRGMTNPAQLAPIAASLRELAQYTLVEDVEFAFREVARPDHRRIRTQFDLSPTRDVCLFSGGVDSFVGLWWATKLLGSVDALFCAHSDQSWIIRMARRIHARTFRRRGVRLRQVYVPAISKQGYAQLRGFLYFMAAGAWMKLLGASRLIITEVGPTMYQPRFAPFDLVTLTTHPYVVAAAREAIAMLLGRDVQIVTPFEDMTKAEVIALAPPEHGIRSTHSCISQRFGSHDGTCYGCIVRRLAAIAAGVKDVTYDRNPLTDSNASRGNLLALLRFSADYLTRREGMQDYEVGEIIRFGKEDLFRRFALDNLAALHQLMEDGRRLAPDVRGMYRAAVADLGGTAPLEDRLVELRTRRTTPTF